MLLGTLEASLLGNLSTSGKGIMRAGDGIVCQEKGVKKTKFAVAISSIN